MKMQVRTIELNQMPSGAVSSRREKLNVYYRGADGSLRHEWYWVKDGEVAKVPEMVVIHNVTGGFSAELYPGRRIAEVKAEFHDPRGDYESARKMGEGLTKKVLLGASCYVLKTRWNIGNAPTVNGKACLSMDLGVVIEDETEFPNSNRPGGRSLLSRRIVAFEVDAPVEASLFTIPEGYSREVTGKPSSPSSNPLR